MNEQIRLAHNAGVARAISLAKQSADIIEGEGDMAGPRDPVSVEALRTFAREAANLLKPLPVTDEEA
ncbi:hypothetical protein FV232_19825 [Methylobacterium sp. WL30]|uniref:hypothetical protein n=1 Tax=unclassified Methylobacterium TaxID=2615210 RepID=UPI0011CCB6D2|nr:MULTISPECIES: hypothetical protein [unclassified Methylobacterium]TXN41404.1 hypothetical protein FV225_02640 [Methylobacterium sp. WL93]TXN49786.1 hypothetical protein FV227_14930 [Methylobacterium sp. WL119]TXN64875.1 hypothetical protein FV232_19825 [Methylobacterium sp. WL30]